MKDPTKYIVVSSASADRYYFGSFRKARTFAVSLCGGLSPRFDSVVVAYNLAGNHSVLRRYFRNARGKVESMTP